MLFEYEESDNPKQIMECKNVILNTGLISERVHVKQDDQDTGTLLDENNIL
jgi:hypothetical protein